MSEIVQRCSDDINWRQAEIALLRKTILNSDLSDPTLEALRRYAIPALYAIWEGYVVATVSATARIMSEQKILAKNLDNAVLTHVAFQKLNLSSISSHRCARERMMDRLLEFIDAPVSFQTPIATDANVGYKSLDAILHRFGITCVDEKQYKSKLEKLVSIRNKIAHGNREVKVSAAQFSEFCDLITGLMGDLLVNIEMALDNKTYLRTTEVPSI